MSESTTTKRAMSGTVELTYAQAVNTALRRCLDESDRTLVYGEDVAKAGGIFGVTRGLRREYGERVFDTPISESAILGSAIGSAIMGMRPIVEIMWVDFSLVAFDQIVNQLANVRYVSRGEMTAPVIIRTQQGSAPGACAQHSQSLEAFFLHVPGIRVCMPWTAQDAYDLLIDAFACGDPVLVLENRNLYLGEKQPVTLDGSPRPIGGIRNRRSGTAATVVSWGAMTGRVLQAADTLAAEGIDIEVLETPWLNPFPDAEVIASVRRTGLLAVAHEANLSGGFGAEVVARVMESGVSLRAPALRIGVPDSRIPAAPSLMKALVPQPERIVTALRDLVVRARTNDAR